MIDFGVRSGSGMTRNALLNRANKEAAYKQTPLDTEFEDNARRLAKDPTLETTKHYRDYESKPRLDLTPSSSFISGVRYEPSLGICFIQMNGETKTIPMTPDEVAKFVTADSLGQHYNNFIELKR